MKSSTFALLITLFSFFTFFWSYTTPPALYWDENYHIASAQKYLNSTFFMEPHPPLGKLLIAAGEYLFDANPGLDDDFIGTDYAKILPENFSFRGYRFFPALLAWLIAPLLFIIFLYITRKPLWAFLLSFLYVFDNALITHSRAAMLDSTMLFFCVATLACFFLIQEHKNHPHLFALFSILFGMGFGAAMATKALALIMILLVPVLLLEIKSKKQKAKSKTVREYFCSLLSALCSPQVVQFLSLSLAGFLIVYLSIWQLHFSLGKTVIPSLPDDGYYQASETYQSLVQAGQTNMPLMLKENLDFLTHYSKGVPELNLCKSDENGSPWYFWPFGGRSINYRWETPNGTYYKYITLQVNPVVWGVALTSVLLAFIMLIGSLILPGAKKLTYRNELCVWTGMWTAYMIAVANIDRVMYLYHYFIPLIFSFIIVAYVLLELQLRESIKEWALLLLGFLIVLSFQFYRPLSYYEPLSDAGIKQRALLPMWDLRCATCDRESKIALPVECQNSDS